MVEDRIERETQIAAPVERVWELLTTAEHVGRWFGDAGAELDLRPGGAMVVSWAKHGSSTARFERVEPPHRLSYRWAPFQDPGGVEPVDGNSTLVEFTLEPGADGGTRLRVIESGFATLNGADELRIRNREGNLEGWRLELLDLREYAEKMPV